MGTDRAVRRSRAKSAALAAVLAAAASLGAGQTGLLHGLESQALSLRFEARGTQSAPEMVVVAVDDKTFAEDGIQWPLPRRLHARALDRLRQAGARQVVYDVQFTEQTTLRDDNALFDAVSRFPGTVLATTETDPGGRTHIFGGDENVAAAHALAGAGNLPAATGANIERVPYSWGGLRSMAVVTAGRVTGRRVSPAGFSAKGALIDYRGPPGTVRTISFTDLVHHRIRGGDGVLRGKIVVIGASAPSLQDVHATPVGGTQQMPGAEVQANAIWTVLHGVPLRDAPRWADLLLLALMAVAAPLVSLRWGALGAILAAPLAALVVVVTGVVSFNAGVVLILVPPLVALIVATVAASLGAWLVEQRERLRVSWDNERLETAVANRTRELAETQREVVERLARAAESRDGDTGAHIDRMSRMCYELGRAAGMSGDQAERLRQAALLHDVGKIGIPDAVLNKPGRFTDGERAIMQTHTTIGASILAGSSSELVRMGQQIALTHHERWDGTGYPDGLMGEQIPLEGRICAVCDVFDALLSKRAYKDAWSLEEALAEIAAGRGTHFEPRLVDAFLEIAPRLAAEMTRPDEVVPAPPASPVVLAA